MNGKKFITTIILLVFLLLYIVKVEAETNYNLVLGDRTLRKGDEGVDVALLQQKLRKLSIYKGKIDGIYGSNTMKAVKIFQSKNGLTVDGIAGKKTYNILPQDELVSRMNVSREELIMLARVIHGEARGESFRGKVGVGAVVINRVEHSKFPDSIREVATQKGQFSCLLDGQANLYPTNSSIKAAKAALMGYDPTSNSLFFYNPMVATNLSWISRRPVVKKIGSHLFAR
ncbi:MAG: cell wall hydrolase [Halanaerobiales bacterium]